MKHRENLRPAESLAELKRRMLRHFERIDEIVDQHGKVWETMRSPRWRIIDIKPFFRQGAVAGVDVKFRPL